MLTLVAALLLASPPPAAGPDYPAAATRARRLLEALVAADLSNPPGNEARAAALGQRALQEDGIAVELTEFAPGRQNLVARLKGDGSLRPLLLLAHTDVVGAAGQEWSSPPHQLTEKDGYLVGRGVADDLGMAAVALEVFRLLKRQGTPLKRDVILAWTGDEESGGAGIRYLLTHRRASIDAEIALNEGGGVVLGEDGKPKYVGLQVAEKLYQDFRLSTTGPTGHSSVPLPDNAIFRLSAALTKIGGYQFPVQLSAVTRAYFAGRAALEDRPMAEAMRAIAAARGAPPRRALTVLEQQPLLSANLRTTCVATLVQGGTRENALPAAASANVNCRILPGQSREEVRLALARVAADERMRVDLVEDFGGGASSPLEGTAPKAIAKVIAQLWPNVPVVPFLSRGATDSRFLREVGVQAYGMSPLPARESDGRRAHGVDERIPAESLRTGVELLHKLVLELAAPP